MAISSPEMMFVPKRSSAGVLEGRSGAARHTQVDVTKTTAADFAANTILVADAEILHEQTISMRFLLRLSLQLLHGLLCAFGFMAAVCGSFSPAKTANPTEVISCNVRTKAMDDAGHHG